MKIKTFPSFLSLMSKLKALIGLSLLMAPVVCTVAAAIRVAAAAQKAEAAIAGLVKIQYFEEDLFWCEFLEEALSEYQSL